jgi:hypothetical protein
MQGDFSGDFSTGPLFPALGCVHAANGTTSRSIDAQPTVETAVGLE